MRFATILLSANDMYTCDGKLPPRPQWDKQFLTDLIRGENVSPAGYELLANSMREVVTEVHEGNTNIFPLTIREIAKADILMVVRSEGMCKGRKFNLSAFNLLLKFDDVELYRKTVHIS